MNSPRQHVQRHPSIESVHDENKFYKDLLISNLQANKTNNKYVLQHPKMFSQISLQNLETPISHPKKKCFLERTISKNPFKVLDAPFLQDDYYLNVIDWSRTNDLAVALGPAVYTWNFDSNSIKKIS